MVKGHGMGGVNALQICKVEGVDGGWGVAVGGRGRRKGRERGIILYPKAD